MRVIAFSGRRLPASTKKLCSFIFGLTLTTALVEVPYAQTLQPSPLPEVQVHGTTPLIRSPIPREHIPANVQVATGEEFTARAVCTRVCPGSATILVAPLGRSSKRAG